jgi:hypothetical protein
MSTLIQALESRTFFSVSTSDLAADKATLLADAAHLKAEIATLISDSTAGTKAISADFKGLPKSDQTLLKTLVTAENKARSAYLKDDSALVNPSDSLAFKGIALGDSLLTRATVKTLAAESDDITALSAVTTVPLATLQAQLSGTAVDGARAAILSALAGDATITTAVSSEQTTVDTDRAAIAADATQFQTDITALAADLTSVHTATGTFPATVGTYTGTATETAGKHKGQTVTASLVITSQDANGNIAGTVTNLTSGSAEPVIGTVSLNGVVSLKSAPESGSVKVTGTFSDDAITGHVSVPGAAGTFTVAESAG